MLPIMLNLHKLSILLIGQGEKLYEREKKLYEAGAEKLTVEVFKDGDRYFFAGYDVVMIVGLDDEMSAMLYDEAKQAGCLVNVEDKKPYCDFFFQSFVKRGDLLISVSTNGKSPGTAKLIRDKIEETFPPEWADHIEEIANKRADWKASGQSYDEVNELTKNYVADKKWL